MPRNPTRDPVDLAIGARIRTRRRMLNLTQSDLGRAIGTTFQQIQKYESGANALNAARLVALSAALDVGSAYFLSGLDTPANDTLAALVEHRQIIDLATEMIALPQRLRASMSNVATAVDEVRALAAALRHDAMAAQPGAH